LDLAQKEGIIRLNQRGFLELSDGSPLAANWGKGGAKVFLQDKMNVKSIKYVDEAEIAPLNSYNITVEEANHEELHNLIVKLIESGDIEMAQKIQNVYWQEKRKAEESHPNATKKFRP
jgi:hypothetical protein